MSSNAQDMRKARECLAVDARRAIQNARFWMDYEEPDHEKAKRLAEDAEVHARQFRRAIEAEIHLRGES